MDQSVVNSAMSALFAIASIVAAQVMTADSEDRWRWLPAALIAILSMMAGVVAMASVAVSRGLGHDDFMFHMDLFWGMSAGWAVGMGLQLAFIVWKRRRDA